MCSTVSGHQLHASNQEQLASSSGPRPLSDCIDQNREHERMCETQDCQLGGRDRSGLAETGVVSQSMTTRVVQIQTESSISSSGSVDFTSWTSCSTRSSMTSSLRIRLTIITQTFHSHSSQRPETATTTSVGPATEAETAMSETSETPSPSATATPLAGESSLLSVYKSCGLFTSDIFRLQAGASTVPASQKHTQLYILITNCTRVNFPLHNIVSHFI